MGLGRCQTLAMRSTSHVGNGHVDALTDELLDRQAHVEALRQEKAALLVQLEAEKAKARQRRG